MTEASAPRWVRQRHTKNGRCADGHLTKRPEPDAHLIHQKLRLFQCRKVLVVVELVVMDELGIRQLRTTPRRMVLLVRKDAHRSRDRDVLGSEVGLGEPLPVETRGLYGWVRQPG